MFGTRSSLRAGRGSWRLICPAVFLAAMQAHAPFAPHAPLGTPGLPETHVTRGAQASAGTEAAAFDLDEATVADLQRRMEAGRDTSRSLVEKYLRRIDAIDRNGPMLHSVIEVNPDALAIADRLDAERNAGRRRGPLHGVPVLIKDNIATADGMMTTAGSLALAGVSPPKDAFIAGRLREAGAVILGKTNLSEWANFRSTHSTSGWSGRGGLARNPYALDRNASGSSSGSGAAIAANLAAVAIGTETDGSIVSPSNANGLVGIKPTLGLVSRTGIVPIAQSQDTAGPMARTVADAATVLGELAGVDPDDAATSLGATKGGLDSTHVDYTRFLDANGLRGTRLGVVRNRLFGSSPAADRLTETAIADMRNAGAVIVDPANIPTLGQFDDTEFDVLLYEFKAGLAKYLTWLGAASPVHSLKDIIAFNEAHAPEEMPYFGQEIMLMAEKKGPLTEPKYRAALAKNHRLSRSLGIDTVMTKYRLDALVAPTGGPAWLTDLVNGDGGTASAPGPSTVTAVAGYPHITVPAGFFRGLPVGVSFFGRAWSEPTLIKIAYAYEQATRHRRPPTLRASVDLAVR
jgi:amidase